MTFHPQHRPHHPRTPFRTLAVAMLMLGGLLAGSSVDAQPLFVSSFTPTAGDEGTQVDIFGGVFTANPDDLGVFIHDGADLGVVLDGVQSTPSQWTGTLGPSADTFYGEVFVWRGQLYAQAPGVYAGSSGAAYWIDRAEWFVKRPTSAGATGPGLFHVESGSSGTVGGLLSQHMLEVDFSLLHGFGGGELRIDLDVMIDGGSSDNNGNTGNGEGRMMEFGMTLVEGHLFSPKQLATDTAGALEARFGAFGLTTEVNGTVLRIGFDRFQIANGFAVLSKRR
ncbi:MAG: hypothetical protein AAGM22_06245 [Acidobacteriota bacterium]